MFNGLNRGRQTPSDKRKSNSGSNSDNDRRRKKTCRKLKLFFYVTYVRTQGTKATYTAITPPNQTKPNHIRKLVAQHKKSTNKARIHSTDTLECALAAQNKRVQNMKRSHIWTQKPQLQYIICLSQSDSFFLLHLHALHIFFAFFCCCIYMCVCFFPSFYLS